MGKIIDNYKQNISAAQQAALDYSIDLFKRNEDILAVILGGSVAHGYNTDISDLDFNFIVSNEFYEEQNKKNELTYHHDLSKYYKGGYIDAKYVTIDYLKLVAIKGNEPTRFAFHDAYIMYDRTNKIEGLLKPLRNYPKEDKLMKSQRFLAQFEGWKWYSEQAIEKEDKYLLDLTVSKLILYGGRLILLHNEVLFPYFKWFMRTLSEVKEKPYGLMEIINKLVENKSSENIQKFFDIIKNYQDWNYGKKAIRWTDHFVKDTEIIWMTQDENIENL